MSQIIKNGSTISLADVESVESKLPIGTYNLVYIPLMGFRLQQVEDFKIPDKIYGDMSVIDRSITVYKHRERNFGLLLSGLRGAGKSLLMKKLALELHQPVIILNDSFEQQSDELIKFLTDPALGDCTILFDEFEKKFKVDDVTPLTLLDGPYNTHHFFILTVNNTRINENLTNRPGRIYYHLTYSGLDDATIREVGEDRLNNKEWVNELVNCCEDIRNLSFDMLISIINDVNLFNQSPKECIKLFGFDCSDGAFVKVHQILPSGTKDVTPQSVWMNPTEKYIWVEDVTYLLNDGSERETDLRLDLSKMVKISKSKYRLQFELTANRVEDEDRKNFTKQNLEFEITTNPNRDVKFIF
jgi:hypothetical protein